MINMRHSGTTSVMLAECGSMFTGWLLVVGICRDGSIMLIERRGCNPVVNADLWFPASQLSVCPPHILGIDLRIDVVQASFVVIADILVHRLLLFAHQHA